MPVPSARPEEPPPGSRRPGRAHLRPADFGVGKLFDVIREAVVVADADTERIVMWNPAASAIFGYSLEEALSLPLHALVPEQLRSPHRRGIARYRETGHGPLIDQQTVLELPALHKDGHEIRIEFSLTPIDNLVTGGRYAMAIIRDVTERVELDRMKNDFVAMIAHDLRSPMSVLIGLSETLQTRWERLEDSQRAALLQAMGGAVSGLDRLVQDVLQVARLESGQFSYELKPFDLGSLVERTVREVQEAEDPGPVGLTLPKSLPPALGDERRNWQILTNLLSNARKFSPPGAGIHVEVARRGSMLQVSVRDEGIGIEEAHLSRLFSKFSRLTDRGEGPVGGTGLGLFICKSLVEAQGGEISVISSPGRGSTFTYTIPGGGELMVADLAPGRDPSS